jgi:hypothetical protein
MVFFCNNRQLAAIRVGRQLAAMHDITLSLYQYYQYQ